MFRSGFNNAISFSRTYIRIRRRHTTIAFVRVIKYRFFFSPQSRRRDSHPTPTKCVNTAVTSAISVAGRTLCARASLERIALRGNRVLRVHEPSSSPRGGVLAEKNKLLSGTVYRRKCCAGIPPPRAPRPIRVNVENNRQ